MNEPIHNISLSITDDTITLEEKLKNLPDKPGVYQFKDAEGKILYIGKAVILKNRVRQYFHKSRRTDPRIEAMVAKIRDVELIATDSEIEALMLEATLIKKIKPRYNIDLKDDKSYPFIVVTNEPFPRVFVTRKIVKDGSKYFGPYTDVKTMRASLKLIRDVFKVRSCNYLIDDESIRKKKYKLCLDYHIKKCDGPCEGFISRERYAGMIHEVMQCIKGKTTSLATLLEERMQKAAEEMQFEEAAEIRDKLRHLTIHTERHKIIDADLEDRDLFSIASEGNDACGVVFKVREGKLVGKQHVYMSGVERKTGQELFEQYVQRFYLESEDIPAEVLLPVELETRRVLEEWLSRESGKAVKLLVPKIGEKAKLLLLCQKNAELLLGELKVQKMKRDDYIPHPVIALQRDLRLAKPPRRIECFDISNLQGTDTVASMVVFINGKPKKSEYRKFKIHSVQGPDDFSSMREAVGRRYSRMIKEQQEVPDLIMVDGGKGQLSSAVEVLSQLGLMRPIEGSSNVQEKWTDQEPEVWNNQRNDAHPISPIDSPGKGKAKRATIATQKAQSLPVIGLAKRLEEVFLPGESEPLILPRSSSGLKLLQQIRDEAHRFAITYHRSLRDKRTLQTELDEIKGVGKKRAQLLLETFGSVQGVKFATQEQLAEIVGGKIASIIKAHFIESEQKG